MLVLEAKTGTFGALGQRFSECSTGPQHQRELVRQEHSRPHPRPTDPRLWGWSPAKCSQALQVTRMHMRTTTSEPRLRSILTKIRNGSVPIWQETNSRCSPFHLIGQHHFGFKVSGTIDFSMAMNATPFCCHGGKKTMQNAGGFAGSAQGVGNISPAS